MASDQNNVKAETNNPGKKGTKSAASRVKIVAPYSYVEELVVSSPSERNWRGIFIALLVIVAVLGLIVFSIVLVSPPEEGPRVRGRKPSLEDIFLKLPQPSRFNGTWISDCEFVYRDTYGGISIYNADNLTTSILMTNITFRQYNALDFKTSKDLKYVLLITDISPVYDHTKLGRYYVFEVATGHTKPLSPIERDENAPCLQYVTWSTNGTSIAFVHNNDIYYKPKIHKDLVCRITASGRPDIFNGIPDWLYETEILKTDHTLWFSPDGQYLLYVTFNDTKVGEYRYPWYDSRNPKIKYPEIITFNDTKVGEYRYPWYDSRNPKIKYPEIRSIKYPKVETSNPEVSVWIVNLSTPKYLFPIQLRPTNSVEPGSYLTSASFYGDHDVALVWLNRQQNVSVILNCRSRNNFNCTDFHVEKETSGWTEPIFHPVFSGNGTQALARLPVRDGNNGHYMHICQIYDNNVLPLTHGAFELTKILAWDEENHIMYVETSNPEVSVWIVNLSTPKYLFPIQLRPTNSVEPGSYLTSASFYGDHDVALVWLNRQQNVSVILNCRSRNNFNCTDFHVEKETSGWTEPIFHPVFSGNGTQALARLPVRDGNNGHYMHICQIYDNNVLPLTHGAFELTKILAWDEENHIIYAIATNEKEPGVRHLFKVGDYNSTQPWTCLTCKPHIDTSNNNINRTYDAITSDSTLTNDTLNNPSTLSNYRCEYNNVIFSQSFKYYVQECLGPDVPVVFLVETGTNYRVAVLSTGSSLRDDIQGYAAPQVKRISVTIEGEYIAQVRLYLPPILREYEEIAFPTILLVDSKPGTQSVTSEWDVSWPWYLASTRNYIVIQIDARGSGFQGEKMRKEILSKIGSVEVQDQLAVLTYLREELRYIDKTKICVVGHGYGGYVSAMMLMQDINQIINCSVSISPITNWYLYNSFFTERYLGFPSRQFLDYEKADLTKRAGNIKGKHYLLVHGTADTTVKPQHSMKFARSLIEQEIMFQQLVYPDESYRFSKRSLLHLYKELDQFFNDSFGPTYDDWEEGTGFFIQ
ncbi:Prolyl oligopeptidase family [Popillia japonica]|uniref:Venom dipeptidyl peptidase 4 n=1 Tax=Popillia japonica TaxID=7064 RepID=A0AAW1LBG6_POPJA